MGNKRIVPFRLNDLDGITERDDDVYSNEISMLLARLLDGPTVCVRTREFNHVFWQNFGHSSHFGADDKEPCRCRLDDTRAKGFRQGCGEVDLSSIENLHFTI
jgi:hypothetical protein